MKIEEMYRLENLIEEILENDETTRKDDMRLYFVYCQYVFGTHRKIMKCADFERLFWNKWYMQKNSIKSFASVERARRKIQAKRPELKDTPTADARMEESLVYEQYALS